MALEDDDFINPLDNPDKANAQIAGLLAESARAEVPVITEPPADLVELPGGLVKKGEVIKTVTVRELTGEHEETLAKAKQTGNWAHFVNVLLECGTVRVGDKDPSQVPDLLKGMLVGDRNQVLLGVRQATYGDRVEIPGWQCPACGKQSDIGLSLAEDIDVVKLDDPKDATFTVWLRKGGKATVRLATGKDELAVFEQGSDLTPAERDSILLSRCITMMTGADGIDMVAHGLGGAIALKLSIPDRHDILREGLKRQPGPRYNEVKVTHQLCGEEVPLGLGLGDLFPDI